MANAPPSPARHRLLFETGKSRRRLFRPGDPYHPGRREGKTHPDRADLPEAYRALIDWYLQDVASDVHADPLLALYGSWGSLLDGKSADDYVRELREGWE